MEFIVNQTDGVGTGLGSAPAREQGEKIHDSDDEPRPTKAKSSKVGDFSAGGEAGDQPDRQRGQPNHYSVASLDAAPARTLTPIGSASSSMRNPGE